MEDDSGLPRKKRGVSIDTGNERPSKKSASNPNSNSEPLLWDAETLRYQNSAMMKKLELYRQQMEDLRRQANEAEHKMEISNENLTIADLAWKQLHENLRQTLSTLPGTQQIESFKAFNKKPSAKGASFISSLINSSKAEDDRNEYTSQEVQDFFREKNTSVAEVLSRVMEAVDEQQKYNQNFLREMKSDNIDAQVRALLMDNERLRSDKTTLMQSTDEIRSLNVTLRTKDETSRGVSMKLEEKIKKYKEQITDLNESLEEARTKQARVESRMKDQLEKLKMEFDSYKVNARISEPTPVVSDVKMEVHDNGKESVTSSDNSVEMAELLEIHNARSSYIQKLEEEKIVSTREIEALRNELHSLPMVRIQSTRQYQQLQSQLGHNVTQLEALRHERDCLSNELRIEKQRSADEKAQLFKKLQDREDAADRSIRDREKDLIRYRKERDDLRLKDATARDTAYSAKTVQALREQIATREAEFSKLKEQSERYRKDSEKLQNFREEAREGQKELRTSLDQKIYEARELQGKVRDMEKAILDYRGMKKQWNDKERELRLVIDSYQRESRDRRDIQEIRASELKYRDEVSRLEERLTKPNPGIYDDTIRDLESKLAEHEEKKKEMTTRLVKAERAYKDLKLQYDQQKTTLETYASELNEVTVAFEDSQEKIKTAETRLQDKEDALTKIIAERVKKDHIGALQTRERETVLDQIKKLETKHTTLEETISLQNEKNKLNDAQIRKMTEELRKKDMDFVAFSRQHKDMTEETNIMKTNVDRIEKDMEDLKARLQDKAAEVQTANFKCTSLEERILGLTTKIDRMKMKGFKEEVEDKDFKFYKDACTEYKKRITCTICNENPKDTVITRCFHTFCAVCVKKKIELRSRKCPACGKPFAEQDVHSIF